MNNKRKGNKGQAKFAAWLQAHGVKAMSDGSRSGGGIWKGDIHNNLDMNFEVKTCKKINLLQCWNQTNKDASLSRSMPVLAVHFDGMPENTWLVVMHSEDWIEYVKQGKAEAVGETTDDWKRKRAFENLKRSANEALKVI